MEMIYFAYTVLAPIVPKLEAVSLTFRVSLLVIVGHTGNPH